MLYATTSEQQKQRLWLGVKGEDAGSSKICSEPSDAPNFLWCDYSYTVTEVIITVHAFILKIAKIPASNDYYTKNMDFAILLFKSCSLIPGGKE